MWNTLSNIWDLKAEQSRNALWAEASSLLLKCKTHFKDVNSSFPSAQRHKPSLGSANDGSPGSVTFTTAMSLQWISARTVPFLLISVVTKDYSAQLLLTVISVRRLWNFLPERPLMTDRRRNGFHGDPILVEEGPFCTNVSRSASSLKLCLQTEKE